MTSKPKWDPFPDYWIILDLDVPFYYQRGPNHGEPHERFYVCHIQHGGSVASLEEYWNGTRIPGQWPDHTSVHDHAVNLNLLSRVMDS